MELITGVVGAAVCAGGIWWTRKGPTLAQLYRQVAAELILRALAREARSEVLATQRHTVAALAGVSE